MEPRRRDAGSDDGDDPEAKRRRLYGAPADEIYGEQAAAVGLGTSRRKSKSKKQTGGLKPEESRLMGLANNLYGDGQFEEAEAVLRQLIKKNAKAAAPYVTLGVILEHQNKLQESIGMLMLAAELSPEKLQLWKSLAVKNRNLGRLEQAIECYDRAIKLDGTDKDMLRARAELNVQLERYGRAAADTEKLLAMEPHNSELVGMLARLYYKDGKPDKVMRVLAAFVDQVFDSVSLTQATWTPINMLAEVYVSTDNADSAIVLLQRVADKLCDGRVGMLPVPFREQYGAALLSLGRVAEARAVFDPIATLPVNEHGTTMLRIAEVYTTHEMYAEARAMYEAATAAGAAWPIRLKQADVCRKLGDTAAANDLYRQVIEVEPANYDAALRLSQLTYPRAGLYWIRNHIRHRGTPIPREAEAAFRNLPPNIALTEEKDEVDDIEDLPPIIAVRPELVHPRLLVLLLESAKLYLRFEEPNPRAFLAIAIPIVEYAFREAEDETEARRRRHRTAASAASSATAVTVDVDHDDEPSVVVGARTGPDTDPGTSGDLVGDPADVLPRAAAAGTTTTTTTTTTTQTSSSSSSTGDNEGSSRRGHTTLITRYTVDAFAQLIHQLGHVLVKQGREREAKELMDRMVALVAASYHDAALLRRMRRLHADLAASFPLSYPVDNKLVRAVLQDNPNSWKYWRLFNSTVHAGGTTPMLGISGSSDDAVAAAAASELQPSFVSSKKFVERMYEAHHETSTPVVVMAGHMAALSRSFLKAAEYYFEAFQREPDNPMILLSLGLAFLHLVQRRTTGAPHDAMLKAGLFLRRYFDVRGGDMEACYNLGRAFHQLRLYQHAERYYRMALDTPPQSQPPDLTHATAYHLYLIYQDTGNADMAASVSRRHLSYP